jgi:phage terminase small subunit
MTRVNTKKPKHFVKTTISPAVKKFTHYYAKSNNGTQSVLKAYGKDKLTRASAGVKATRLLKNDIVIETIEQQKARMNSLASKSINVFNNHLQSDNEQIANTTAKFVYEQVHGKAIQRNINANTTVNIADIISKLQ